MCQFVFRRIKTPEMTDKNLSFSPIVLFIYKRPHHTRQTLDSLKSCIGAEHSDLIVYADGPKVNDDWDKIQESRSLFEDLGGFKGVRFIAHDENRGLARSIIEGVSDVLQHYGTAIVVEDDLITSRNFLLYMNRCLQNFRQQKHVVSISGYTPKIPFPHLSDDEIYLSLRPSPWGWATWQERWEQVDWNLEDFDTFIDDKDAIKAFNRGGDDLTRMLINQRKGVIDSWAIRWIYHHYKVKGFAICPRHSKVKNIGTDGTGTHHVKRTKKYDVSLDGRDEIRIPHEIEVDENILEAFRAFYRYSFPKKIKYQTLKRFGEMIGKHFA